MDEDVLLRLVNACGDRSCRVAPIIDSTLSLSCLATTTYHYLIGQARFETNRRSADAFLSIQENKSSAIYSPLPSTFCSATSSLQQDDTSLPVSAH